MNVAIRNANDAISLSQTAEGALSKINDMGQRMRELAVQSANATNNATDRESLDAEFQALSAEIKRVINEPGLYMKLPSPLQDVRYFDKRTLTYDSDEHQMDLIHIYALQIKLLQRSL